MDDRVRADQQVAVRVVSIMQASPSVKVVEVAGRDAGPLALWAPGAHVEIDIPGVGLRQYSLCGNPADRHVYQFAVRRERDSRGGSEYMHANLKNGDQLTIHRVRNRFQLVEAESYLFLAGGIGITPILPMVSAVRRAGKPHQVFFANRHAADSPFLDILRESPDVHFHFDDRDGVPNPAVLIEAADTATAIYCCGPAPFIDACQALATSRGITSFHFERFAGAEFKAADGISEPFEVEILSTGDIFVVQSDESLLEALNCRGFDLPFSCTEGSCGTCEIPVSQGEVDHRDVILTDEERAENSYMYPCVSRSLGPRISIDI
ncbi:PDR/VanB family oxidoreductase [Streptomyces albipurpureus]|uniref:PDR/VanB family oxidoreductase n=1 Tax=Streptomyces albipurpureus TaxID=2897419 RepID=A0ABT0UZS5_9ACTN|nr:PDR/VanB family oxidoreductase [Streptomyces sp. CWNU-1]MCM2394078.1 PDR/VanB family oxidoreductase [Streptomyces sp. CWNU-1]